MAVFFTSDDWKRIKNTYTMWWNRKIDRPVIGIELVGKDPGRACPNVPMLSQSTCADLSVEPQALMDRLDYEFSKRIYIGDAYPYIDFTCFGPGVMAAFLGAKLDNSTGNVWFHPSEKKGVKDLHFEYDPENKWFKRVKQICQAAVDYWGGDVLIAMPDLGGAVDVLSTFLPGEQLLFELYDNPEKVIEHISTLSQLWHRYFAEIDEIISPTNHGYSDWSTILSPTPSYILQCDFAYMISLEMFNKFVKGEIADSCNRLDHSIYHLDGQGQLVHLDSLLEIKQLDAVQWVPGAGAQDCSQWPEVYEKIVATDKAVQIINDKIDFDAYDKVIKQIAGRVPVQVRQFTLPIEQADIARKWIESHRIASEVHQ